MSNYSELERDALIKATTHFGALSQQQENYKSTTSVLPQEAKQPTKYNQSEMKPTWLEPVNTSHCKLQTISIHRRVHLPPRFALLKLISVAIEI